MSFNSYAEGHLAKVSFVLNVTIKSIILSAIVLSVVMLNIIILNFIMLNRREKILYYSLPNGARTVRQMLKCQMTIYQKAKVFDTRSACDSSNSPS
jgi:hypothetical protein